MKIANEIKIEIPEFMTHVNKSKFKYFKINGQALYSGNLHPRVRALVVEKMHEYISGFLPENLDLTGMYPLKTSLQFYAPVTYGDVRLKQNKKTKDFVLCWKVPNIGYMPSWDADNQWIWGKCFNDVLKIKGIIPDDNVHYIKSSGEVIWEEVSSLEERKLVFTIKQYNNE